jgi:hypothetical protein
MRIKRRYVNDSQRTVILHLGDHDPSGIDMTRDILERLQGFLGYHGCADSLTLYRIALNMDQVEEHNPPPNPAKLTDSRCAGYMDQYGDESWELDALRPDVLIELIRTKIMEQVEDLALLHACKKNEDDAKRTLGAVRDNWTDVVEFVGAHQEGPDGDDEQGE